MSFQAKTATGAAAIGIMLLSACGGGGEDSGPPEININEATELTKVTLLPTAVTERVQVQTIDSSEVELDQNNLFLNGSFHSFVRAVEGDENSVVLVAAPNARSATYFTSSRVMVTTADDEVIKGQMLGDLVVDLNSNDADLSLDIILRGTIDDGSGSGPQQYGAAGGGIGGELITLNNLAVTENRLVTDNETTLAASGFITRGNIVLAETDDVEAVGVFAGVDASEIAGGAISGDGTVSFLFSGEIPRP